MTPSPSESHWPKASDGTPSTDPPTDWPLLTSTLFGTPVVVLTAPVNCPFTSTEVKSILSPPSNASGHPSASESVSNWFGIPSLSVSGHAKTVAFKTIEVIVLIIFSLEPFWAKSSNNNEALVKGLLAINVALAPLVSPPAVPLTKTEPIAPLETNSWAELPPTDRFKDAFPAWLLDISAPVFKS